MEPTGGATGGHALSLRVMRLNKPAIVSNWPLIADALDMAGNVLMYHFQSILRKHCAMFITNYYLQEKS